MASCSDLGPFLAHSNQTLVEAAAVSLGILARPRALPLLRDLATDSPEGRRAVGRREVPTRVRAFAAYGLGLLAQAAPPTRPEVAETLLAILDARDPLRIEARVAAAVGLGLFEDPSGRALGALEARFADPDEVEAVRAHAPVSIAKILERGEGPIGGASRFVPAWIRALRDPRENERVRESCALAIGLVVRATDPHSGAALEALDETIRDGRGQARKFAAIALGEIGGADAAGRLRRHLARGKRPLRPWASLALGVLCHGARAAGKDIPERGAIVGDLVRALGEERNPEIAAAHALALGLAGDSSALGAVEAALGRIAEEESRGYVCLALGLLGAPDSAEVLRREVADAVRKPSLLREAAIGLGLLGDGQAVPLLLDLLGTSRTLAVQTAVVEALAFVGDARCVEDLLAMLGGADRTEFARASAAVALGLLADPRPLPWNAEIGRSINYRALVPTLLGTPLASGVLDIL